MQKLWVEPFAFMTTVVDRQNQTSTSKDEILYKNRKVYTVYLCILSLGHLPGALMFLICHSCITTSSV